MKRLSLLDIAAVAGVVVAVALIGVKNVQGDTTHELLNVSYDPTRELYRNLNAQFIAKYQGETGVRLQVKQSHGGSSRQARTVVAGEQQADVVTPDPRDELQIVYPPVSILAEPYVAWVDANVARHHSERYARAYLEFLFGDAAQQTIAQAGYRPFNADIAERFAASLPPLKLFPITAIASDWDDANHRFFDENGIVDTVLRRTDSVANRSVAGARDKGAS